MTDQHFEELWERCENLQREAAGNVDVKGIIDDLMMKLTLYKAFETKSGELPAEEFQKGKARMLGEVLLAMTCLSFKDNINVFEALNTALYYRSIQHLDKKFPL